VVIVFLHLGQVAFMVVAVFCGLFPIVFESKLFSELNNSVLVNDLSELLVSGGLIMHPGLSLED
jgi:hypothetical protein